MPVIEADNISYSYTDEEALSNVDLKVEEGEFVTLIGPNGSGKTTLTRILLGALKPDEGSSEILGTNSSKFDQWGNLGYIPQNLGTDQQFPGTVRELLKSAANEKGVKLKEMPESVKEFADSKYTSLSGGQKRRTILEMATMNDPDLIILDEPGVGVDPEAKNDFYDSLKQMKDDGSAVLLITHELGVVKEHADRIVCIDTEIRAEGSVEDLENLVEKAFGKQLSSLARIR